MKFTPGPWEVDPMDATHVVNYDDGRPYTVAEFSSNAKSEAEQIANARLAAMAPAMLHALLVARTAIVDGTDLQRANALRDINAALRGNV